MSIKILGLDLGTNSIGWAVVDKDEETFELKEKGVRIFQEGVKIEKGIEGSKAAERTGFRSARRLKFRRKLRKVAVLKILSEFGFCPTLSIDELSNWRYKKIYPKNEAFREWYLTDTHASKEERQKQTRNPYYYRNLAVTEKLNLNNESDRFIIGRAFYHIAQRRGFLSNRLETTKEQDGKVMQAIGELSEAIGDRTLGQYFYTKYTQTEKIRDQYTHRNSHYLHEFETICTFQNLPEAFVVALKKAIFMQRPLKSQKGLIGKCVFEPSKQRCSVSHPAFEEYRMLCFINNIKIKTPDDEKMRFLTPNERSKIAPLFYRKSSKDHFDFEDIAKQLAPKNQYKFCKDKNCNPEDYLFNYGMKTTVSSCPVTAHLKNLLGENLDEIIFPYIRKDGKASEIDVNDIWHVLFTFDSDEKLAEFAKEKLHLNEVQTSDFLKIRTKQEYASLSLKAIRKILPYLREGLIYSHAVFLANMEEVIPENIWKLEENRKIIREEIRHIIETQNEEKQIIEIVNGQIKTCREEGEYWSQQAADAFKRDLNKKIRKYYGVNKYASFTEETKTRIENSAFEKFKTQMQLKMGQGDFLKIERIDDRIKNFLQDNFGVKKERFKKMYHPSALDVYKAPKKGTDGQFYLASPMVASIRNPMAMRAMHQLRKVINELLKKGLIDAQTRINIEMARDLMNANERSALKSWQNERENDRKKYAAKISEFLQSDGQHREPGDDEILKYQLWEEQNHKCVYTGNEIALHEFLGSNPSYDIEHTIPRSISFDNSQENKTLCEMRYNRAEKRNRIPYELAEHDTILARIEHWKTNYENLDAQINKAVRSARAATTKEAKDFAISRRHKLTYERNYWRNKYQRFTMKDVPDGFKNSQIVDTGIITKYARMYLNTLFDKVYTVKGNTVADFRKIWGLQDEYNKKARVNHIHHCIDAITIACITKSNYEQLAQFYHEWEELERAGVRDKPHVEKPWKTFTEDVKKIENEVLISHYTPDVLPKQSKKILKKRGKIQYRKNGEPIFMQGDTVRGSLHNDSYYGRIKLPLKDNNGKMLFNDDGSLKLIPNKNTNDDKLFYVKRIPFEYSDKGFRKISDLDKIVDDTIREKAIMRAREVGLEEMFSTPFYLNDNKTNSIKKVRCQYAVKGAFALKKHKDKSKHNKSYKEEIIVGNDENYALALYERLGKNNKVLRAFEPFSNFQYAKLLKKNHENDYKIQPFKVLKNNEFKLRGLVKIGACVLLYKENPCEIWKFDHKDLQKRLYKVFGFRGDDGRVKLRFHKEARPDKEQESPASSTDFINPPAKLILSLNKFNALIEGIDFKLTPLGEIIQINSPEKGDTHARLQQNANKSPQ